MELTNTNIENFLKNAWLKLVDEASENIAERRKGKVCNCTKNRFAQNLIYSIKGLIPESQLVGGNQAGVTVLVGSGTLTITLKTVLSTPAATYEVNVSGTAAENAIQLADYINSLYPATYSYTAIAAGNTIVIFGSNYDEDNGVVFNYDDESVSADYTLADGNPQVLQDNNCLTDEEVQKILSKINQLISPCEPISSDFCEGIGCMVVGEDFLVV